MSSSSARADSANRTHRFRGLLILALLASYPGLSWWTITHGGRIGEAAMWIAGAPQIFCYIGLLWLFGSSLRAHKEPILTRMARFVRGEIPADVERYTRKLTLFWCVFFAIMATVSAVLLLFVSRDAWLFFANVLNLPLLMSAFVAEYLYRCTRFPDSPSVAETIRAFRKFRAAGGHR